MHSLRWACQQSLPDGASQRRLTVCHSSSTARPEATSQRRSCQLCIPDGASQCHFCHQSLPDGASQQRSCQLRLPDGALASISATAPRPATNLIRRRRSPVWLAIWRTWAGFANSQHGDAAFATPDNICAHSSLLQTLSSCSDIANLSAHLHRLPTPPPYLRRMRLSPGRDAGVRWVIRLSPGRVRRSCKSPRARILVLGTSGAH